MQAKQYKAYALVHFLLKQLTIGINDSRTKNFQSNDKSRSGSPMTMDSDYLKRLIQEEPKMTAQSIADVLDVCYSHTFNHHLRQMGLVPIQSSVFGYPKA